MSRFSRISRRDFLEASATLLAAGGVARAADPPAGAKTVAAVITEFRHNSHAEVIAGRWLEGSNIDGTGGKPQSQLVAMFTDQVPASDMSRKLSEKHHVPIYPTIRDCLCRGGNTL